MTIEVLYFMPCMVCFVWSLLLLLKKRNRPQNYLLIVLLMGTAYYAAYTIAVSPRTNYTQMAYLMAINQFLVPSWMVFQLLYLESHLKATILNSIACFFMFVPLCVHSGIVAVMYYLIGFDNVASFLQALDSTTAMGLDFFANTPKGFEDDVYRLFYTMSEKQFHIICLLHCFCTTVMAAIVMFRQGFKPLGVYQFLKGEGTTTTGIVASVFVILVILLQCPLMLLGRSYIVASPYLGVTITLLESICIFVMSYVEYMSQDSYITLRGLASLTPVASAEVSMAESMDESYDMRLSRSIEINDDEVKEISIISEKITSLMNRVQHAFEVEKVYQNPDLTLQMLAEKLNTNRTTLATALKFKYRMTFKEYLSHCRIEKAKEYMLSHPDEVIEAVADKCGFAGSSNFAHKFKDEVGESPRAWLQARLAENRNKTN